ncbi:helix-turn-helix domain-containing protein [Brevibacillus humidisoli]|uniref:bifunctional transcriptional activator/DNA repair enzyme AdaA n=1 Tax=Brevibacillus humidisoli TaxID=2895522 RepID=UPI001E55AC9D|nr:Ada metal-binding domain-containing protein [Brevibacillus humidisoli]UFJ40756.1 helix-turn-helix domain-containing protein [Brevibacillus humidisoli]
MNDWMWRAIASCDPAYDGQFYYGLVTTGVFCRPSCRSRTPKRDHVRIFYHPDEARQSGLRPCKRCRPEELDWRSPEEELAKKLVGLITDCYHETLTLADMSQRLFVSPFYLQRCFTRVMKMSPGQYLRKTRIEAAKQLLTTTDTTITEIAQQVGFHSSAHFSSVFHRETSCTPTEYRLRYREPETERMVRS